MMEGIISQEETECFKHGDLQHAKVMTLIDLL
jgi:hypothetical protein